MHSALRQATRSAFFASRRPAASVPTRLQSRVQQPFLARTIITKKYTKEHECVIFDSDTGVGTISITDHAQSSLGDVVFVELPGVGQRVEQGDQIGAVESVKAASDIYAPVTGQVKSVNEALNDQPGLLNKSPEDEGWLCTINLEKPEEMDSLMTEDQYKASWES